MGLGALWHIESSWTRDRTHVSCIGKHVLDHQEVPRNKYFDDHAFPDTEFRGLRWLAGEDAKFLWLLLITTFWMTSYIQRLFPEPLLCVRGFLAALLKTALHYLWCSRGWEGREELDLPSSQSRRWWGQGCPQSPLAEWWEASMLMQGPAGVFSSSAVRVSRQSKSRRSVCVCASVCVCECVTVHVCECVCMWVCVCMCIWMHVCLCYCWGLGKMNASPSPCSSSSIIGDSRRSLTFC